MKLWKLESLYLTYVTLERTGSMQNIHQDTSCLTFQDLDAGKIPKASTADLFFKSDLAAGS